MRSAYPTAMAVVTLVAVSAAASSADRVRGASGQQGIEQRIEAPSTVGVASPPLAIALDSQDVEGVLGKEVRSSADENMGRIVNVVVDRNAQPRAAVIDFGGFLGIGSRKLAVDWNLLQFGSMGAVASPWNLRRTKCGRRPNIRRGSRWSSSMVCTTCRFRIRACSKIRSATPA